jgi:hypothetical protein
MKYLLAFILALTFAAARPVFGDGIVVGFTSIRDVAAYPQSVMDDIAQFRWYFAHASVGDNMMSGVSALNSSSNTFYRFRNVSDDSVPPSVATNAVIYDYNRGNPGWQAKTDGFRTYVSNGWRFPRVNLVLDKLCYIDQNADVDYYIASMTNLEAVFPETVFVYATIPLTTSADSDNDLRNTYNKTLRNWARTNNRVLFDIADIEAHDTDGVEYTYTYSGRTNQMMCSGNSSDGGHLNTPGCRQVALGFYAVCYALLRSDRDGDGMSDGHELIAGMCPTDPGSVFKFGCPSNDANGGRVVSWSSASNRFYVLRRLTNVVSAEASDLLTNATATPPLNCYTDSVAGTGPFFYKVGVRQ